MDILNRICEVVLNYNNKKFINKPPILVDAHSEIGKQIISYGFIEKHLLTVLFEKIKNKNALKGKISIDIGANIGSHSIFFSNYFQKIYSFEPVKRTFKILELNTENFTNIEISNLALSDSERKSKIYVDHFASGLSSIEKKSETFNVEEIQTQALDQLNFKNDIALIKIDVEGHELNVLKGGRNTIKKNSPLLLIEFQGEHRNEIINFVKSLLYDKFYVVKRTGFYHDFKTHNIIFLRAIKMILGFFISQRFVLSFIDKDELLDIETEMLICLSPKTKIQFK